MCNGRRYGLCYYIFGPIYSIIGIDEHKTVSMRPERRLLGFAVLTDWRCFAATAATRVGKTITKIILRHPKMRRIPFLASQDSYSYDRLRQRP